MGYILLWIEQLAAVVLLVATLIACGAHLKQVKLRVAFSVLVAVVPLIAYLLLIWGLAYLRSQQIIVDVFFPIVLLTVCYVISAVGILYFGLNQRTQDATLVSATNWPRGRLALMLAIATGLHMMTWWNLDLSVKQQLAALQAESGALGLSVAPARIPDRENAALVYELAYEAFDQDAWPQTRLKKWRKWTDFNATDFNPNDPDLQSFLREQEPTLILLRQAGRKPGCHFGKNYARLDANVLMPELGHLRQAARLLALDARVRAAKGETQVALQNVATLFAIAEHVGSEPILISTLVSIASNNVATQTLQEVLSVVGKLDAEKAPTLNMLNSIDLDGSLSFRRLLARSLRAEEAFVLNVFREPNILLTQMPDELHMPEIAYSFYRLFMVRSELASYRKTMNTLSQIMTKAYHKARKDLEQFDNDFKTKPKGFVTSSLMPSLSKIHERSALGDARHRTARLALATARYRAANGHLPKTLDALVPKHMTIIPRDPFDGKPMKYRLTEEGAIIYSIGADAKDDNGVPLKKKDKLGDITFKLIN